jgi:hypothetical protein
MSATGRIRRGEPDSAGGLPACRTNISASKTLVVQDKAEACLPRISQTLF